MVSGPTHSLTSSLSLTLAAWLAHGWLLLARTLLSPWVHINELARFWRGVTISYFDDRRIQQAKGLARAVDELSVPLLGNFSVSKQFY
jgi:hypothetical protein